jgi:hypothetical protein
MSRDMVVAAVDKPHNRRKQTGEYAASTTTDNQRMGLRDGGGGGMERGVVAAGVVV